MQSVNRNRPPRDVTLQTELSRTIADRQEQIATGKRLDRPSDDPSAWAQISDVAKVQANMEAWLKNIDRAQSISNQAERVITEIGTQLTRVNELVIQASNGTMSAENRAIIAQEIEIVGNSIADLVAQNDSYGRPLFSDTQPLDIPIDDNVTAQAAPAKTSFDGIAPLIATIVTTVQTGDETQRSALLDPLKTVIDDNAALLGRHGIESAQLEKGRDRLLERQIDVSEFRSSLEDTNMTTTITELQRLLVNLEAAQATYARIEQTTLFDQIR